MTQGSSSVDDEDIRSGPRDELYWWFRAFEATLALEMREGGEYWVNRTYTAPRITRRELRERLEQLASEQGSREDDVLWLPDVTVTTGRATLETAGPFGLSDEPIMARKCNLLFFRKDGHECCPRFP